MALPAPLANLSSETLDGLGGGRRGDFRLAGEPVHFERGLDRLQLFDLVTHERAASRYRFEPAGGPPVEAVCQGRQTTLSIGGAEARARPARLACQWQGTAAPTRLTLDAVARAGGREERQGVFSAGPLTLELQSVHRWDGAALPVAEPVGYVMSVQGRPVGALELNGTPRLWRPAEPGPLRDAVTWAALALALSWGPGG
ncbi:hypothetical protein [Piscinibacter sakaiensis]|uniref:Uncharacterized protein n=1 Tax=Piscinibacter sakaiensis TaxID=1547922 RepID=A0A0K8NWF8_PISS1|nr:hypothetical protein [Piscinibacter sakaiensis]GAP34732.1 hypothetical protein ISF6_5440 [Piscinibacter sakaiensis]